MYLVSCKYFANSVRVLLSIFTFLFLDNVCRHRNYRMIPNQDSIVRQHVKWDFPYLGYIEKQTVLALVSTHPAVDLPEPLSPNVIPVGGLQIIKPKPLPDVFTF